MKILCLSDSHGELPDLQLDGIDLVLHAGDFSLEAKHDLYKQLVYYRQVFCPWARKVADQCGFYWISGNHEVFMERMSFDLYANDVYSKHCINNFKSTFVCKNESVYIYGFPWTNQFYDWAFNADDTSKDMGYYCHQIPSGTDILLCHGPPYGVMDLVPRLDGKETLYSHAGSIQLALRLDEIKPKLVVFGHLHSNFGILETNGTKFVGCSLVDEDYQLNRSPIVIEI